MSPDLHPTLPLARLGRVGDLCLTVGAMVVLAVLLWWAAPHLPSSASSRPANAATYEVRRG